MNQRPALFIGSSAEGLSVAYAIQQNLEFDCEPTVWSQGVFQPSSTALFDLYAWTRKAEFAVFVFTPDDVVQLRGQTVPAVRDNVIFELGLFIGALGPGRCFFVLPHGSDVHLPSDLFGIEPLRYVADRRDGNLRAALGPSCNQIRAALVTASATPAAAASSSEVRWDTPDVLADEFIRNWDAEPLVSARRAISNDLPLHINDDPDGLATEAFSKVFTYLNSMADGVLSQRVDEHRAYQAFALAVVDVWTRAYTYFVPAGSDPTEAWTPLPPLGQLARLWSQVAQ